MSGTTTQTTVTQVDMNMDDLFGPPAADSIISTEDGKAGKANVFSSTAVDTSFLDNDDDEGGDGGGEGSGSAGTGDGQGAGDGTVTTPPEIDEVDKPENKSTKKALTKLVNKLIEDKMIAPFDEDKPVEEYTMQDFTELFQLNFKDQEERLREKAAGEIFESFPEELQYAAKYVADGGTDMKGLFRALAHVEETRDLDVEDESDQELIAKEYLRATKFGDDDEITEEIRSWKDLGKLKQKAEQFKPKLDTLREETLQAQLSYQEEVKNKRIAAANKYAENVYKALEPSEINGIKLDKKTQAMLYSGLVQVAYPSITGRPTNLLGHLLEKYQYVEPKHDLIAEVLWHLADPDGFKKKLKDSGASATKIDTVKKLKTEQANRIPSGGGGDESDDDPNKPRKIKRIANIFSTKS